MQKYFILILVTVTIELTVYHYDTVVYLDNIFSNDAQPHYKAPKRSRKERKGR